jgi:hypothetical protein
MQIVGEASKAPLRLVKITDNIIKTTDEEVRAIVPALAGIVFLDIECSAKTVLQHIIPRCPCLRMLYVHSSSIAKQLRPEVPKHITVIW